MLAKDLIDRLEQLELLDRDIIEALRDQLQQSGARVTPEQVAKLLVDNGQLTTYQATKLIGDLRAHQYEEPVAAEAVDDNLIAGMDDDPFDDSAPVAEAIVEGDVVEAVPVEAVPVQGGYDASADAAGIGALPPSDRPRRKSIEDKKSVWDSFKVYGFVGIIVGLLLLILALKFVIGREDEQTVYNRADEFYSSGSYEEAQQAFIDYLDVYGDETQYSSAARVKVAMTELYKAAQFKQQPERAVQVAKEKLPPVAEEPGMNDERGNLAGLLVEVAENITSVADNAEETERKRELLVVLKEHYELLDDPLYMSSTMKANLAPRLEIIEEDRARVKRDIQRNIDLDASESEMQTALESKNTKKAYDVRTTLLDSFPELHDNDRLMTLIRRASDIQQTLVEPAVKLPKLADGNRDKRDEQLVVLTTLNGRPAPRLKNETFYLRTGGSILAFNGSDGSLRWRNFVGYAKDLPPVRIDGDDGVLLSDSQAFEVVRVSGDDGRDVWRSVIGEPFLEPISNRSGVYVTAPSGHLFLLDTEVGDVKWGIRYPQTVDSGPGRDESTGRLYQAGGHSNLYVLDGRNGDCTESFYIGHGPGTVIVPPIALLGHVFVIENATADIAKVHVLRINDEPDENGNTLSIAQPPFRLVGNVRVTPEIDERKVIILTDRGEVTVLDIEVTAEGRQVEDVASLPAFYDSPTETQMAVDGTSMWIAGKRIGRYDLQYSRERVVRRWSEHELDTFVGRPYVVGDVLIHARRLRDSEAVRVSAAEPDTGKDIWRTDVGVPIADIRPAPGGKSFHAFTSGASLFELDQAAVTSGTTKKPLEDPGAESVGIRYKNPVDLPDGRMVMLDVAGGDKLLLYDPKRPSEKLREVTMQLPAGAPDGGMVFGGGGMFLTLDSGRAVLVNPVTGGLIATPFQPASQPGKIVQWTRPQITPDDADQVIVADDRKKIYRLRLGPQLRELASSDLPQPLLGPAAIVGANYVATYAADTTDHLVGYSTSRVDGVFDRPLNTRCVWGPVRLDDNRGLLMTSENRLIGFDAGGNEVFATELPEDMPVGDPVVVDGRLLITMSGGNVVAVDPQSGAVAGRIEIGQPLSAAPLSIGNKLLVPGAEGVLYIVDAP